MIWAEASKMPAARKVIRKMDFISTLRLFTRAERAALFSGQ